MLMKILLLSPFCPYPPNWGFVKRVFHLLERLAVRHDVTLLTYVDAEDEPHVNWLRERFTVHTVARPELRYGKRMSQLASLPSPWSFQRRLMLGPAMQQALDELSRTSVFDVVHISSSQMACFRFDPRSALVLDEHNIEYELYYRVCQTEGSLPRRLFNWLEYVKFKREEMAAWRAVDGCAMTSAREAGVVNALVPQTPTVVAPNAVDTEYFAPSPDEPEPDSIVLTGLMKYRPNLDGAVFFVREILPLILRERPGAKFYIVGGEPPAEVTRLASSNVIVTGSVADVRPFIRRAAVVAVPLRMGGGTRLKVLEGLAMGKPMVSTSLGCEGIDVTDREHLLIADGAERFAGAIVEVLCQPELATNLGRNGRARMLERYRWDSVVDVLDGLYQRLVDRPT